MKKIQLFLKIVVAILFIVFIKTMLLIFTALFLIYIVICVIDILFEDMEDLIPIRYNIFHIFNNLVNKFL